MLEYISTLPDFLIYLGIGIAWLIVSMTAYVLLSPQHELSLIRQGNVSASVVFSGTLLGLAIPLASAIAHSVNLVDLLIWGAIACIVQVLASLLLRAVIRDLQSHIAADRLAVAITMAALKIAMGLINAAAIVY